MLSSTQFNRPQCYQVHSSIGHSVIKYTVLSDTVLSSRPAEFNRTQSYQVNSSTGHNAVKYTVLSDSSLSSTQFCRTQSYYSLKRTVQSDTELSRELFNGTGRCQVFSPIAGSAVLQTIQSDTDQ